MPDRLDQFLLRFTSVAVVMLAMAPAALAAPASTSGSRPNVIIILADDMGYSDLGCYGGEIRTPNIDKLAAQGVRFAQFYNMARCCPTRAALLTGLYPHQAGIGAMNQPLGRNPAYQGELNTRCVTIAEVLRERGYRTAMVGKWHLCHVNIASMPREQAKTMLSFRSDAPISASKANWPCNRGFDKHWGTIPGVEDYYDPYGLVHNEQTIKPDTPDFYYTDFITDHAARLINEFSAHPDQPFFLYVAYTAPHWPMQAREQDVARYADTYSVGWDRIREIRFERMVRMGLVKKEWTLSPRASNPALNGGASVVGPWEEAPAKDWQARRMAVYAAMIECLDAGVGRILQQLVAGGIDDNTMVVFLSDNGGCQENVQPDWYDIPSTLRDGRAVHVGNDPRFMPGPEEVYQSYGPAWANASNTPFRRFKHFAEEGGISTPFIVRWPGATMNAGGIQHDQVGSVIDLMPTVLDAAGATYPIEYKGRSITAEEGMSLVSVIRGGATIPRPAPLCWEHEGNRAVRVGDWKLVAADGEAWKLFNIVSDRCELHDRSSERADVAEQLRQTYGAWAKRVGVEPWPIR